MKANWKLFSVVLILIAALYGGYLLFDSATISMPPLLPSAPGPRLFMSMEGFSFSQSENGRVSWRMHAGNADLYDSKEAQLKDIELTFISADQKQATLIGESGQMDTTTGNGAIRGGTHDVRIVTSDGYLLTTASLFWKAGERLVNTPEPFKLLGNEIYLEGKGLTGNVDIRKIMVNSNVKAVLQE